MEEEWGTVGLWDICWKNDVLWGKNTNGNGGGDNNVCCDGDVDGIDNDNGCAIVVTNSYDNHNNDSGVMMVKT